jgi:hypothetical protein
VVVIDSDLGQSGASSVDREGFQRLVAEVGMGHAAREGTSLKAGLGAVLGKTRRTES